MRSRQPAAIRPRSAGRERRVARLGSQSLQFRDEAVAHGEIIPSVIGRETATPSAWSPARVLNLIACDTLGLSNATRARNRTRSDSACRFALALRTAGDCELATGRLPS